MGEALVHIKGESVVWVGFCMEMGTSSGLYGTVIRCGSFNFMDYKLWFFYFPIH